MTYVEPGATARIPYQPPTQVRPPSHAHHELAEVKYDPDRRLFERCLDAIKNVLVIITCVATLYSLLEFYLFLDRLQTALRDFSNNLSGIGG